LSIFTSISAARAAVGRTDASASKERGGERAAHERQDFHLAAFRVFLASALQRLIDNGEPLVADLEGDVAMPSRVRSLSSGTFMGRAMARCRSRLGNAVERAYGT